MKVSIIIPVYNVAPYIGHCIKSVMDQTYSDGIECILVNDVTPDDSIAIAERLIADYNGPIQFRILSHEQNRGLSATRNTGIDAATGDYLYFFDSDDEITPDCIEKLVHPILKDPTIEMVEGCYMTITTDRNNVMSERLVARPQLEFTSKETVREFFFSNRYKNIFAWNKLVNRKFVLENQLYFSNVAAEDNFWHFHYFKYLSHLYIISDITYKYFKRPNSITTTPNKEYRNQMGFHYAEIVKNLTPNDSVREVKYFLTGFSWFYRKGPTNPVYRRVSSQFLEILKNNHCIKEWCFLKFIVIASKFAPTRFFINSVYSIIFRIKLKLKG